MAAVAAAVVFASAVVLACCHCLWAVREAAAGGDGGSGRDRGG